MRSRTLAILAASTSLALAGPALAQNGDSNRSDQAQSTPEKGLIIVTARKREESILKVPVVQSVLTSAELEKQQITDLVQLSSRVPGLNFGSAVLSIGPQISLRGVGTTSLDAGIDQSVSLNIDGLSMTQGLAYTAGVFDLAQAEVLKGPQALFFGKNSPAGVVSLRSADPGDELEIIGRMSYEIEAEQKRGELILSGPVSDTLGLRLAMMGSFENGHFRNRATAAPGFGGRDPDEVDFAPTRNFIARGTAVYEPNSDFTARLKVNYTNDYTDGDASQGQITGCADGVGAPLGIPFFNPNEDCTIDRDIYIVPLDSAAFPAAINNGTPFIKLEQAFGTLDLNYVTANNLSLTSVTGFYRADSSSLISGTLGGSAASPIGASNFFHRQDFTQEIRVDSDFDGPLNFTLGGFYQDGEIFNHIILSGNRAFLAPDGNGGFAPFLPEVLREGSHEISIESYSVFGQGRWQLVPELELTAGVRYTHESRSEEVLNLAGATPVDISLPNNGAFSSNRWSPEATITYTPTDDLTFFAAVKQGYKSGSFTITTPTAAQPFGDERVRGGEIGMKARVLDRDMNVNLAGYYYKYDGLQVGINEPAVGGLPVIRTLNAGGAEVYGIDFDFLWQPSSVPGLTLNGAINYNHARFTDLSNAPCFGGQTVALGCNLNPITDTNGNTQFFLETDLETPVPQNTPGAVPIFTGQDLTGIPLTRAPEWVITFNADYEFDLNDEMFMRVGAGGRYSSRFLRLLALDNRPGVYQPSYAQIDGQLAIGSKDQTWELALIGNNLTNKYVAANCTTFNFAAGQILGGQATGTPFTGPAGIDELNCKVQRGRQVAIRVTLRN